MPKRPVRGSGKSRACSGDLGDSAPPPKKTNTKDGTLWVDDDTLNYSPKVEPIILVLNKDDSDYEDSDEEEDSDYVPPSDSSSEGDIQILIKKKTLKPNEQVNLFNQKTTRKSKRKDSFELPKGLSRSEEDYLRKQNRPQRNELLELIKKINSIDLEEGEVPNKFRVLKMPIPDYTKSIIIKKLNNKNTIKN
jgi:hypothetical protein